MLPILRYAVFAAFAAAALVAVASWLVRTKRVDPFSRLGRALRTLTDPVIKPVEQWLVKNGGNPQLASWWVFIVAVVGGILLLSAASWIAGQLALASYASTSPRGLLRLVVYYAGRLIEIAIIVRVVGSWLGAGRYNPWTRWTYILTDWLIEPLRRVVPPFGMFDITPIVAWLLVSLVIRWLLTVL